MARHLSVARLLRHCHGDRGTAALELCLCGLCPVLQPLDLQVKVAHKSGRVVSDAEMKVVLSVRDRLPCRLRATKKVVDERVYSSSASRYECRSPASI